MVHQLQLQFLGAIGPFAADRRNCPQHRYRRHGRLCFSGGQLESLRHNHNGWRGCAGYYDTLVCLKGVEPEEGQESAVRLWIEGGGFASTA